MCSPSAPEAPSPQETSAASTGTNVATAVANAVLQNPSQTTPYGSLTYDFGSPVPEIQTIGGTTTSAYDPSQYVWQESGSDGAGWATYNGQQLGRFADQQAGISAAQQAAGSSATGAQYSVGGQTFDSYDDALAHQNTLGDPSRTFTWDDPYTGQTYSIPIPEVTQTLTPEGQALLDQNMQTEMNLAQTATDQSGFLRDYLNEPFSYDPGQHEAWALDLYNNLNSDDIAQQREALAGRLANQGLAMGSEAYDNQMSRFDQAQQDSRNQFLLDSYQTGLQTDLTERNQPINEIIGLMSGSQVQQPNFVNPNISGMATTDNASILANNYNQELASWQQNQAATGSMLSGLGSFAGLVLSDERTKKNKRKIGETEDGLGIYSFQYKGDDTTQIGLMAQEVKKKRPEAVETLPGGLMAVDYAEATR